MPKKSREKFKSEKFKTMHNVFDEFTNRTIFKLISEGYFTGLESPISIGKEANLFSAKTSEGRVMVKIYRLEACDFNKMWSYIKSDPRFIDLVGKKRKIILAWVQREFRNMLKAREAGLRVPTTLTCKNNIIVMEFIGTGNDLAPKLKDKEPKNPKEFFQDILLQMKKLHKAGLVHADLSAFNILNHEELPVLIDFSQCTPITDSRKDEFINRDIKNVSSYFRKIGLKIDEDEILKDLIR